MRGPSRAAPASARTGHEFQIVDDVLDYSGQVADIGKQLGDDLREGKVTLPLIHALASASGEQRRVLEQAIRDGGGDFTQIASIVNSSARLPTRATGRAQLPRPRAPH